MENYEKMSESWRKMADDMITGESGQDEGQVHEPASAKLHGAFSAGDAVHAKAPTWKRFFPGHVERVNEDLTLSVLFTDGDKLESVPASLVRRRIVKQQRTSSRTHSATPKVPEVDSTRESPHEGMASDNLCTIGRSKRRKENKACMQARLQLLFCPGQDMPTNSHAEASLDSSGKDSRSESKFGHYSLRERRKESIEVLLEAKRALGRGKYDHRGRPQGNRGKKRHCKKKRPKMKRSESSRSLPRQIVHVDDSRANTMPGRPRH